MSEPIWKPHVTVAALCQRDNRFLMVKEDISGEELYNQPAGHLEPNEGLIDAVIRETLEETRYQFQPIAFQGVYRHQVSAERTYIRFAFSGQAGALVEGNLDQGVIAAEWMSYDEILATKGQHRSPMVLQCVEDFLNELSFPLNVINHAFC